MLEIGNKEKLYIVTCVSNIMGWKTRIVLANSAISHWLNNNNVHIILVECAYGQGDSGFQMEHFRHTENLTYIQVRANSSAWNKESLLNIGLKRVPEEAEFVASIDADIHFRCEDWVRRTISSLRYFPVVQMWETACDLGADNSVIAFQRSLGSLYAKGCQMNLPRPGFMPNWKFNGHDTHGHPGYAWAWRKSFLDMVGGFFDKGLCGGGDRHMALGIINVTDTILPTLHDGYDEAVSEWSRKAYVESGGRLGYVPGTIEHAYHGDKKNRAYVDRWHILKELKFDPTKDVVYNEHGVIEFKRERADLEMALHNYFISRDEDS